MTAKIHEQMELWGVILFTLLAKWLLTEPAPPKDETALQKRFRIRRTVGGILAGLLCAIIAPQPLINYFDILTEDLVVPLVAMLALTGEHIVRILVTKVPEWVQMIVEKYVKGSKK